MTRRELADIQAAAQRAVSASASALDARARVCLAAVLAIQGVGPADTLPLLETAVKQLQSCAPLSAAVPNVKRSI